MKYSLRSKGNKTYLDKEGFNLCSFDLDFVDVLEPEFICDASNLALADSKALAPVIRTYERIIDRLLQTLMGAKYLAAAERTEKWEVAIPMLDDAIELAQAEMLSIRVSPILNGIIGVVYMTNANEAPIVETDRPVFTLTDEMVDEGVEILRCSGLLFAATSADEVVVRQILDSVLTRQPIDC